MIDAELDDTHLCIKCSTTIVGIEAYIQHRKTQCGNINTTSVQRKNSNSSDTDRESHHSVPTTIISTTRVNLDHTYDTFTFSEPEPPSSYVNKAEHGDKTSKSLGDSYDLPYELGADVFFSSLQLQSVQSSGPSTSGKAISGTNQQLAITRHKSEHTASTDEAWMDTPATSSGQQNADTLMKAVRDISEVKKPYEPLFKSITFVHDSPELSDDEEEDVGEMDDDDDEDYDPIAAAHAAGGKWKMPTIRHSPPVVPETHTGGKWRPENRPNLRVTHNQLTRLSPTWDDPADELEAVDANIGEHPPAEHTKGKWVPGTKMQRLEYKEEVVELAKSANQDYWCNICCRRLKSKSIYENHLKTGYHLKRAEPEQQLEKAALDELQHGDLSKSFVLETEPKYHTSNSKKRKRRATFIKCELCKHGMLRHLVGKHLISHYHYRRMQMNPDKSLRMILENIHSVVLQSPFQCRPCRFYSNTEEMFLHHWNSPEHLDASEGPGKFWCSYCHFECEDNNQMRRHLLSSDHKEVILAINRSVPICISKKLNIDCARCRQSFRYNAELRQHTQLYHPGAECTGTASDAYQSRYKCELCTEMFRSKVALQRHEKYKHSITKYFCSICKLEFNTPCKARRHRKTIEHRLCATSMEKKLSIKKVENREQLKCTKECAKCGFIATSEVEAMLHELSHPKRELTRNTVIMKASASKKFTESIRKATTSHNTQKQCVKCRDCEEIFESLAALKQHRDKKHPLLSHVCMSCGQSFALAQALGRHSRICRPSTSNAAQQIHTSVESAEIWSCDKCNFIAPYESELIFHKFYHTYGPMGKNTTIGCPFCDKKFRKHSLRCHLRQHTNEKIFECQYCHIKFSRRHNLKEHVHKLHESPEKFESTTKTITKLVVRDEEKTVDHYQCGTCGKAFSMKYELKKHSAVHEGSKECQFICNVEGCYYTASTNAALKVHAASHSEEHLKCQHLNCSYIGKSLLHLKRHLRSHLAPSKFYACDKCGFKARIKGHIKRHMRCHTGEKPYQCPHCDFKCSTFDNLRKHVLKTNKHPGKFIYECEQCAQHMVMTGETGKEIFRTNSFHEYRVHLQNATHSTLQKSTL